MRRRFSATTVLPLALLLLTQFPAVSDSVWFGGTTRALPVSLAAPKDDGLRSAWGCNDQGDSTWDLNLGTSVSLWQHTNGNWFHSAGPRLGVATRFQFNSDSFDLWATDVRGGGVYGLRKDALAYEAYFYHESSHLGDELLDRGERERIDYNVNGLRLTASWEATPQLRLYGGAFIQPWAKPEKLQSLGFHAGVEFTQLPPWKRAYLACDAETWEWRSWNPDVAVQIGCFIGPKGQGKTIENSRVFLEMHAGRVMLGQFYNETERYLGIGVGTNW
jgi:hypothetical protein